MDLYYVFMTSRSPKALYNHSSTIAVYSLVIQENFNLFFVSFPHNAQLIFSTHGNLGLLKCWFIFKINWQNCHLSVCCAFLLYNSQNNSSGSIHCVNKDEQNHPIPAVRNDNLCWRLGKIRYKWLCWEMWLCIVHFCHLSWHNSFPAHLHTVHKTWTQSN